MTSLFVHRPRLPTKTAAAVTSSDCYSNKLAIGTENGVIDLFDTSYPMKPSYRGKIVAQMPSETLSVQFIGESSESLVFGGAGGFLTLASTKSFQHLHIETLNEAIWTISRCPSNPNLIAVGCDESIRLYTASECSLELTRIFPVQPNKILAIDWDPSGNFLLTASQNMVSLWSFSKQSTTIVPYNIRNFRLATSRQQDNAIWSLKFLCNDTAVTGDSSNRTVFWDLKTGTSIAEFRAHEAPVLAIETGKDRKLVYATGADSRIFEFYYNEDKNNWCQGACFHTSSPYDINWGILLKFTQKFVKNLVTIFLNFSLLAKNIR